MPAWFDTDDHSLSVGLAFCWQCWRRAPYGCVHVCTKTPTKERNQRRCQARLKSKLQPTRPAITRTMATRTLWAITHTKPASRWNLVPNGMMIHHQPLVHLRMRGYIELPRDSPTLKSNNSTSSAQTGKTNQIQNNQANANASAGGTGADATNPPMAQEMKRILVKNLMDLWNTFKNGSLVCTP